MECKLIVGQKVVHVPNMGGPVNLRELLNDMIWPEPNGVYTVGKLCEDWHGGIGIELKEIGKRITLKYPTMIGKPVIALLSPNEFQPLSFLDIDISVFTRMLDTVKDDCSIVA